LGVINNRGHKQRGAFASPFNHIVLFKHIEHGLCVSIADTSDAVLLLVSTTTSSCGFGVGFLFQMSRDLKTLTFSFFLCFTYMY
jgi:hypothetical protein